MYLNNSQSLIFGAIMLGLASFAACENSIGVNKIVDFGVKTSLSTSQEIWFGSDTSTGIKISVAEIADSRCPEDVDCVWAGEATVQLLAVEKQDSLSLALKIDPTKSASTDTLNFTINHKNYKALLYDVLPYPNSSKDKGAKIATFTILKPN